MCNKNIKNLTSSDFKRSDQPLTVVEKYNILKNKNPEIERLRGVFELNIEY